VKIAVVALGKIGLPLAVQFADKGHEVVGVDVNDAVVRSVNAGREPFPGEAQLQEKLSVAVGANRMRATTSTGRRYQGPTWPSSWCPCSSTPRGYRTSAGWTRPPARSPRT
jgi:UDP-N-acetyl-D-glucosamine dehydrogenase